MRPSSATTLRIAPLSAALTACLTATAWAATTIDPPAPQPTEAAAAASSPPAVKPFDPAVIPEVAPPRAPLGYYYGELTPSQASALRRGFKLPLDALAAAKSPTDLARAVVVAPLPDPNRPLLAVNPASESLANPFADEDAISFRRDPLKALGAMLSANEGQPGSEPNAAAASSVSSPAAPAEDDPFGASDTPAATPAEAPRAEVDSADDPFGAAAESEAPAAAPADEEDPFGAF